MITTDTRAIFQQENSEGRRIFFATSNNGYKLRRKLRDTCLDILGLRLELEKAVKCLYNTNIWNLLWAPPLQGKICLCYSDVLHRNFGELKQSKNSNEAWGPLHRASTPPHHFILNSEVPRCIFVFPPLPLSVPWGCEKDSSSFRIFLLKYGTCVCRNHFLGRVSIFIALFFASPSVFLQILFQKKKSYAK